MKTLRQFTAIMVLATMCTGCAITGSYFQQEGGKVETSLVDPEFERYIVIENTEWKRSRNTNQLTVNIRLRNISDKTLRVIYAWCWYDANNTMTEGSPFFELKTPLEAGDAEEISLVALKASSKKYSVMITVPGY